ncbi:hypothetical protein AEAC466_07730 [Asticcacaulis sp. AC466]|uniref:helix-turn-helix transcriptional regulator n=1 Tax=Asticcacaulis sp. AC466 TaxID=1282362 RepID=UPI0003C40087|nr:helix-turn-helix transcriptional regulator [Asticcacaulis sp. AC466]ESQ84938.1 hypothetical protein AEAC466_07730 [Asticcacaulis sp. AC466]
MTKPNELGDFIRSVRERLRPEDFDLPSGPRRRTPGLRREEAAVLCGISPTWFTWIEQGRTTGISHMSLMAMARGLRLSRSERAYLFTLAGHVVPASVDGDIPDIHALAPLVGVIRAPAYVLDHHWEIVAWNSEADDLFDGWPVPSGPEGGRNLLRYAFTSPQARALIDDWPERSRRLVAEFRADTASLRDDLLLQSVIDDLCAESLAFAAAWHSQEVLAREGGTRRFLHPRHGRLVFEQFTLRLANFPNLKLITLVP